MLIEAPKEHLYKHVYTIFILNIDYVVYVLMQDLSCSLDPSSEVFSISHETLELGEFRRQFTSTLMLCGATERTVGTYQCAVNRTREDVVSIIEIWSASVQLSRESK